MKNNALNFVFNLNKNEIIEKLNEFIKINDYLKNELNNLGFIEYKHFYLNKNKKIKIFYDYEFNSFVIINCSGAIILVTTLDSACSPLALLETFNVILLAFV